MGHLRRGIIGQYHKESDQDLHLYINEFCFRWNQSFEIKKCLKYGNLKPTYRFHKKSKGLDSRHAKYKNEANLKYRHKTREHKEQHRKASFENYSEDLFKVIDWVRYNYRYKWGNLSEKGKLHMGEKYKQTTNHIEEVVCKSFK